MLQKGPKRVHKIPLEVDQQVSPLLGTIGYPKGQKQLSLLGYSSKTPATIPVVDNVLLKKMLKRDFNQLLKSF
jgi:hypothetical protein